MAVDFIEVEVAYATEVRQTLLKTSLPIASSLRSAIETSGILLAHPEIDLQQQKVGVFGQICALEQILEAGNRVEIYRPLQQHPMQARRNRV